MCVCDHDIIVLRSASPDRSSTSEKRRLANAVGSVCTRGRLWVVRRRSARAIRIFRRTTRGIRHRRFVAKRRLTGPRDPGERKRAFSNVFLGVSLRDNPLNRKNAGRFRVNNSRGDEKQNGSRVRVMSDFLECPVSGAI